MAMEIKNAAVGYDTATKIEPTKKVVEYAAPAHTDVTPSRQEFVSTKDSGASKVQELAEQTQVNNEKLRNAIKDINKKANNAEVIYGFHDETNRVTIKIVDKESKKTIKEFPAEQTLDMIAKVWELAGLMVDEKR